MGRQAEATGYKLNTTTVTVPTMALYDVRGPDNLPTEPSLGGTNISAPATARIRTSNEWFTSLALKPLGHLPCNLRCVQSTAYSHHDDGGRPAHLIISVFRTNSNSCDYMAYKIEINGDVYS